MTTATATRVHQLEKAAEGDGKGKNKYKKFGGNRHGWKPRRSYGGNNRKGKNKGTRKGKGRGQKGYRQRYDGDGDYEDCDCDYGGWSESNYGYARGRFTGIPE
eukprot:7884926-Pyramimonas_sp.AAC.1